jgi:hypothetical protein
MRTVIRARTLRACRGWVKGASRNRKKSPPTVTPGGEFNDNGLSRTCEPERSASGCCARGGAGSGDCALNKKPPAITQGASWRFVTLCGLWPALRWCALARGGSRDRRKSSQGTSSLLLTWGFFEPRHDAACLRHLASSRRVSERRQIGSIRFGRAAGFEPVQ